MCAGFAVLFVMANPIVPLLALISSHVEMRGDGFKLLKVHRRPEPNGVEVRYRHNRIDKPSAD
jgi:hypothetical protein